MTRYLMSPRESSSSDRVVSYLARDPEPREIQAGLRFVEMPLQKERSPLTPWQQYAQVILLTNELMFVD